MLSAIDWGVGVEDAWARTAAFVPKLVGFLAILVIGYIVAKAVSKAFDAVLERVGFDRAVERGGIKKALSKSKLDASSIVSKVVFSALFLLVLQMAFGVFGPNPVSDGLSEIIAYLPKVAVAVVIVVVTAAIATGLREIVTSALGGLSYGTMLANLAAGAVITVGVFAALNQLEIAPAIVTGLFYAILATITGSAIVAIGGGGIRPMQARWEQALQRYDQEKPRMQQAAQGAGDRVQQRAEEIKGKAQAELDTTEPTEPVAATTTRTPRQARQTWPAPATGKR